MSDVGLSPSALKEGRWFEYVARFALGGTATVFTGIIGSRYGASVGGLFLGLPAVFCASATLIEKQEIRRKREAGLDGRRRGQDAAALDAAGAALGAVGMFAFAIVFAVVIERSVAAAFVGASFAWLIVAVTAWYARKRLRSLRRRRAALSPRRVATEQSQRHDRTAGQA